MIQIFTASDKKLINKKCNKQAMDICLCSTYKFINLMSVERFMFSLCIFKSLLKFHEKMISGV